MLFQIPLEACLHRRFLFFFQSMNVKRKPFFGGFERQHILYDNICLFYLYQSDVRKDAGGYFFTLLGHFIGFFSQSLPKAVLFLQGVRGGVGVKLTPFVRRLIG